MSSSLDWLPALILLKDSGGDWARYLETIYEHFRSDFVLSRPKLEGKRFALKRHPLEQGKEATFWHLISEGSSEADRLPDLRRCERIRWPRPIIEALHSGQVVWWRNQRQSHQRRGERRIVIALSDFSYVVILADRGEYVLLWTAFCVEEPHRRRKLEQEFRNYAASQKS